LLPQPTAEALGPGTVGQYTSLDAIATSTIYISYYDATNNDLKFATSTNGGSTWATRTIDTPGTVGQYTSLDVIDTNTIYISYYDATNGDLKFAKSINSGSAWTVSTIDTTGVVGQYTSLDVIDTNTIYISYYDVTNGDLKFATSTNSGSTWTTSTVEATGNVGQYTSIDALDANTIFISYYDLTVGNQDLKFAKSTDGGNTWTTSIADAIDNVGQYSSLHALTPNSTFISYYDVTNNDLKFAELIATEFKLQLAQRSGTCDTGFVGETYSDVATSSGVIRFHNNLIPADEGSLTATSTDPTHGADTIVNQTYEEANTFTNSLAAIPAGQDGKWDFALIDNSAPGSTTYCFRVVKSDATLLDTYSVIPEITTTARPTISSAANQVFEIGQATTAISQITITDDTVSPVITATDDLRIAIATSSVDMRWDTTDITATFGGTASGKVSNPISYEGGGSVLVIPVDTDFAAGDTLTVIDLSFTNFNSTNAAVSVLDILKDGPGDQWSWLPKCFRRWLR